jgi:hypothetical protein
VKPEELERMRERVDRLERRVSGLDFLPNETFTERLRRSVWLDRILEAENQRLKKDIEEMGLRNVR